MPSLHALRAFEAVSRHLSYHTAAEELHVTPAAVKQLVSKLESSLGTPLLRRKGRGLELTERGELGQEDLGTAMRHMSMSVDKMRGRNRDKRLILSVEASFATAWLVPKLEAFREKQPHISVLLESSQQIVDLEHSEVDIAIRYGVESNDTLIVKRLFDDLVFPACSPILSAAPAQLEQLEDLQSVTLIHWDMSQLNWAPTTKKWFMWESWLDYVGAGHLVTDSGLHFSDYGLAVQAAIAGQGVILASWPILRDPIDAGLLHCPFSEVVTTDIGYDLVTTREALNRHEVAAFTDWLIETAARENSLPRPGGTVT